MAYRFGRSLLLTVLSTVCAPFAMAQQTPAPDAPPAGGAAAPAAGQTAPASPSAQQPAAPFVSAEEIVIHGIRRGELILPTQVDSSSAYGLDLGVMDTPRNNTVLSHAQLDALDVQDPQQFSYLTSSSYTDASFGVPNVPRIRGQYGDVFFNGMRDSFTSNGYGAPLSYNSIDTIDIVKGPASVQAGTGQGVGGSINISTKLPNFEQFGGSVSTEFDTLNRRRWNLDFGGPTDSNLAYRISYTGEESGSYYTNQFFNEQALYGVVVANISDKYTVQVNSEVAWAHYTENDGVNRVNQQLIDNGTYLTGGPVGPIASFLTPVLLGNPVKLGDRVNIDEAPGTGAKSLRYNLDVIQTYQFNENASVVNNTFYNYLTRYNEVEYYFSDSANDSFSIENKTDFKFKFKTPIGDQSDGSGLMLSHAIDAGVSLRFAHVDEIQNFLNEPVAAFDLSGNPDTFVYPSSLQAGGGALVYTAPFGHDQYGIAARNPFAYNATIDSNLTDIAGFFEHRIQFNPQWSLLYGLRGDFVQLRESDPLNDPNNDSLPKNVTTNWYMLGNGNISPVFQPAPWVSTYLTYNYAQYIDPNSNDGGVGTYGQDPSSVLRQETRLLEGGVKFNLLDKALFISTALFKQSRAVPTGPGGTDSSLAHIRGFEGELNYQPGPQFFATASYSYMRTKLDTPASFYNYPAQPGVNVDGAGSLAVFLPGQRFDDPGVPRQLLNLLANYRIYGGFGVQGGFQVTGPVETTTSGRLDLKQSVDVPASIIANGGYYQSPVIPWQHTVNAAIFYDAKDYQIKLAAYNLTNQHNVINDYPFYGNDFLTRATPLSVAISLRAKF